MIKIITNTFLFNKGFKLIDNKYILVLYTQIDGDLKQTRELVLTKRIDTNEYTIGYIYEVELRSMLYFEEELQEESQSIFLNNIKSKRRLMNLIKALR